MPRDGGKRPHGRAGPRAPRPRIFSRACVMAPGKCRHAGAGTLGAFKPSAPCSMLHASFAVLDTPAWSVRARESRRLRAGKPIAAVSS